MSQSDTNRPESPEPDANGPAGPDSPMSDVGTETLAQSLKLSFGMLKIVMAGVIVIYILKGLFVVKPGEAKIRLTFGRPNYVNGKAEILTSESGWHIKWPWQEVVTVEKTEKTIKFEKEFWYKEQMRLPGQDIREHAEKHEEEENKPPEEDLPGLTALVDRYLISGDANIIHLRITAKYRATDVIAADHAFQIQAPDELLKQIVMDATVRVVARMKVDNILSEGKGKLIRDITAETTKRVKDLEKGFGHSMGIVLTGITLDDLVVPKEVRKAFDDADSARSEFHTMKRQAEAEREKIIVNAEGEAVAITAGAEVERSRMVALAMSDAKRIADVGPLYDKQPQTFRRRYYSEKVQQVLRLAREVWILHGQKGGAKRKLWIYTGRTPAKKRKESAGH